MPNPHPVNSWTKEAVAKATILLDEASKRKKKV
jgi:hypothetical protein